MQFLDSGHVPWGAHPGTGFHLFILCFFHFWICFFCLMFVAFLIFPFGPILDLFFCFLNFLLTEGDMGELAFTTLDSI